MAGGKTLFQSQVQHFLFPLSSSCFGLYADSSYRPFDSRLPNSLLSEFQVLSFPKPYRAIFFGYVCYGTGAVLHFLLSAFARKSCCSTADSMNRLCDSRILGFQNSFRSFWVCFCLPRCSAVVTVTVGKYPPNIIPNKYFCIKMSHFDNDKHYID